MSLLRLAKPQGKPQIGPPEARSLGTLVMFCVVVVLLLIVPGAAADPPPTNTTAVEPMFLPTETDEPVHARCFVRYYLMNPVLNHSGSGTYFSADIDLLSSVPLLITFDAISLSSVTADRCPSSTPSDRIRFTWSDDPDYDAAFSVFRTGCGERSPLYFGMSTLAANKWGHKKRAINDGRIFRPQSSRVSMLTGMYNENQLPQRRRTLMVGMYSTRSFERRMSVSVCIKSTEVPYDMPSDVHEISAPRLLPLVSCVRDIDGRCGVNIGYINSYPITPIELRVGKAYNKLVPMSLENGFRMPETFTEGIHPPESFEPPMRISWHCDSDESEQDYVWKLDGYELRFNNLDFICPQALTVASLGLNSVSEDDVQQRREMRNYQNLDPFIDQTLKKIGRKSGIITYEAAKKTWNILGVQQTHFSTLARDAHKQAEELAADGKYSESTAVRAKYRPTKGQAAAMGIGR